MVHHAKLIKKIKTDCPPEIQAGLNELAKTPEFTKILHDQGSEWSAEDWLGLARPGQSPVQSDSRNQTDLTVVIVETDWTGLGQTERTA